MEKKGRRSTSAAPQASHRQGSDSLYGRLVDSVTEYAIFTVSPSGTVTSWNSGAERTFGFAEDEIVGQDVRLLFTPEDIADGQPAGEFTAALNEGRVHRDCWHLRRDGTRFWATNTAQPLRDEAGRPIGFSKIVRDSTERHLAATALRESEERFRLLIESAADYAMFAISLDGTITLWNVGAERLFGFRESEAVGRHFSIIFTLADIENGEPELELRQASAQGSASADRWYVREDGTRFFAVSKLTRLAQSPSAAAAGFVKIAHDITERKHQEEVMRHEAFHDRLTGLPNRALFSEHLQRVLAHAERFRARRFGLLFLDLDDFKAINDRYGHARADILLMELARRLETVVRAEDVVARFGGDEFTILLTDIDRTEQAVAVADALRRAVAEPLLFDDHEIVTTATIGIAIGSSAYERPEHVLRDADLAMYEAKAQGGNRSVVFDERTRSRGAARRSLESELRQSLERHEFFVQYQPIVALSNSRVVGFEALVRWRHPQRGTLLPSEFMLAAHQAGLIVSIDGWVLEQACRQLGAWQTDLGNPSVTMNVNQSGLDLAQPDFVARIAGALETSAVAADRLRLEFTERTLMEPTQAVTEQLARIRDLGVEFAVDDFGTGYFGLSALRRFGAGALKIDRSFICGMNDSVEKTEIVRTAVTLAHNLRLSATGMGVETAGEASALRELTCDYGQGNYFSRPLDAERATLMLHPAGAVSW